MESGAPFGTFPATAIHAINGPRFEGPMHSNRTDQPAEALTATESSAALPAQLREYRLLEKIGEGGMGTVYRARHERLDKIVALKVLTAQSMNDPAAVARFQREMKAVGKLDHPNIIRATTRAMWTEFTSS